MLRKSKAFFIILYVIALPIIILTISSNIRGIFGTTTVITASVIWGLKGGILSSTWLTALLIIRFIMQPDTFLNPLIIGIVAYWGIGLILGRAMDSMNRHKQELYNEINKREEVQCELEYEKAKYRTLIDTLPEIVIHSDANGKCVWTNKHGLEFFGEGIVGSGFKDSYVNEKDWINDFNSIQLLLGNIIDIAEIEALMRRKDGSQRTIKWHCKVLKEDGKVVGIISTGRDVTYRKEVENELAKTNALLEGVLDAIPDVIDVQNPDHTIIRYNKAGYERFNKPYKELINKKCYENHGSSSECELCGTREAINSKEMKIVERYIKKHDRYIECRSNPILDENGQVKMIVEILRDITDRKKMEKSLKKKSEEQEMLLENIDTQVFYLINPETYGAINKAHADFLGVEKGDAVRKSIFNLYNKEESHICIEGNKKVFDKKIQIKDEEIVTNKKGEKRILLVTKTPKLDENENVEYVICTAEDITERKEAEERVKYQAYHDSLTSLFNRTYFDDKIENVSKSLYEYVPCSILSIDMDGLKIVNDTFGHKVGDDLLKEVAKIISSPFKSTDIIARTGGDEFSILLPKADHNSALKKRSEIVAMIDRYNKQNPPIPISMSIGVATCEDTKSSIYETYQKADNNMYRYKLAQSGSSKSKIIDLLMAALSERDYIAYGHGERLTKLSEIMAKRLKLTDDQKRNLILLSKVHDLGKLGIPDNILFKPDRLTDEEYEKMKEHSKIGYEIANRSRELTHIANLILHHHERWDGKGYPNGLTENDIPLECRILSVLDAFDAMTSDRPYHKGIDWYQAMNEIKRCSGYQFDPKIAEGFIELFHEEAACSLLDEGILY